MSHCVTRESGLINICLFLVMAERIKVVWRRTIGWFRDICKVQRAFENRISVQV